jgi:alkyl hydroperoxide reductase subunit F
MSHQDWNCAPCSLPETEPPYPEIFDTIIIGAGPAGMTAAIYAARRKMKILLLCGNIGGQLKSSSDIENWTGVAQSTGPQLAEQFFQHVKSVDKDNAHFDLWVREKALVEKIAGNFETGFEVSTKIGKKFKTRTIICTTGKVPRTLNIPGEKVAMDGNGLSFCATCDAPLYKDKKMVVIGGGNSAMDVALQLEKFTDDITIFCYGAALQGEICMIEKIKKSPRISVKYQVDTQEILLDKNQKVTGIKYMNTGNSTEEGVVFTCEGIFEEIGQIPSTQFLKNFISLNEKKEIPVNRNMHTSIRGFFAGGDCTNGDHKQVVVAASEGAIAALEAHELLLKS